MATFAQHTASSAASTLVARTEEEGVAGAPGSERLREFLPGSLK